MNNLFGLKKNF